MNLVATLQQDPEPLPRLAAAAVAQIRPGEFLRLQNRLLPGLRE